MIRVEVSESAVQCSGCSVVLWREMGEGSECSQLND